MKSLKTFLRKLSMLSAVFTLFLIAYSKTKDADLSEIVKVAAFITSICIAFTIGIYFERIAEIFSNMFLKDDKLDECFKPYRHLFAVHEAGHAIVAAFVLPQISIKKVSIIRDGANGGYVRYTDAIKPIWTANEFFNLIVRTYGGRAAEEVILGEVSTGPEDDVKKASEYAYSMVNKYAFKDNLLVCMGDDLCDSALIEDTKNVAEEICKEAYEKAKGIIMHNRDEVIKLAKLLEEKEELNEEEVAEFIKNNLEI